MSVLDDPAVLADIRARAAAFPPLSAAQRALLATILRPHSTAPCSTTVGRRAA